MFANLYLVGNLKDYLKRKNAYSLNTYNLLIIGVQNTNILKYEATKK